MNRTLVINFTTRKGHFDGVELPIQYSNENELLTKVVNAVLKCSTLKNAAEICEVFISEEE